MTMLDWAPAIDVAEEENAYVVSAELPEVKKEDAKVSMTNGILTISGKRRKEREEKKGVRYHRVERCYGSFLRRFTLPDDADPSKVTATMKDGVLKVRIEKLPGLRQRPSRSGVSRRKGVGSLLHHFFRISLVRRKINASQKERPIVKRQPRS